ncbi:nuclear matrix protein NMP200 [Auricularia subglabra TFB-10046 SS5]|nr:nuclear matrix protein NMP200 [Auricularia subglabra TFB-10046 SS5]
MFFCAISGEPPQDPVVSAKSGHVYERRLITKYIADNGTDPVTGEKLEESDLVSVKATPNAAPPRPPNLTSIPALLHTLQNEWDALVLETFALKQQYQSTRQELSNALYQQDAATRVVARLIRERDAAREALADVQATMGIAPSANGTGDVEMDTAADEPAGLPADIVAIIDETQKTLSDGRKKRKTPAGYATAADLKGYAVKDTISSLHSASTTGINSLVISRAQPSLFLTGGNDKIVQLYDRPANKVVATLKGHTKKVNQVQFREKDGQTTLILSASADKSSRIWAQDAASGEYAPHHTIKAHKGEITGLAVHPTQLIVGLSSSDKTYSLHNLATSQELLHSAPFEDPFASISVHPDGTFYALGTSNGSIQIYDARTGSTLSSLELETGGGFSVHTSSFSENGYHLAAPSSASSVAIWDLRKLKPTKTVSLGDFSINRVLYDYSGQYLAVAGSGGARVFAHKSWDEIVTFGDSAVTDVAWGEGGKEFWGSAGREVKIWSAS